MNLSDWGELDAKAVSGVMERALDDWALTIQMLEVISLHAIAVAAGAGVGAARGINYVRAV